MGLKFIQRPKTQVQMSSEGLEASDSGGSCLARDATKKF